MKAKTRIQKEVFELSQTLAPITANQKKWAKKHCFAHKAHKSFGGRCNCMDCGASWQDKRDKATCVCPQCKQKLKVEITLKRKFTDLAYCTFITAYKHYQIVRVFLITGEFAKGQQVEHYFEEVAQTWLNAQGKQVVLAKRRFGFSLYFDSWVLDSELEVKKDSYIYERVANSMIYPRYKVLPIFRRNGFANNFFDISPIKFFRALLDNRMETLFKVGEIELFRHFLISQSASLEDYWQSIRIVLRNKYVITDVATWCDHISTLKALGKDIRNPKFICPTDLQESHDYYNQLLQRRRQQELDEIRHKEDMQSQERFYERRKPYFGLCFSDGLIQVAVLDSIKAFEEEGKAMKHCVYQGRYYDREDSLILSATIEGKRIETIELSLQTLEVVQCRGKCNGITEYHERIINLVNANTHLIAKRMTA